MSSYKENEGENMCIIDEIALGKIVDLVCKKIGEAFLNEKWKIYLTENKQKSRRKSGFLF